MYYFIGPEAKLRDNNKHSEYETALNDAKYAAKKLNVPVRIFIMKDDNTHELYSIVKPGDIPESFLHRVQNF